MKYRELTLEVQMQLKEYTKAAPRGDRDRYLRVMDAEWSEAEDALTKYTTWSTEPKSVALKTKLDSLRDARDFLIDLKKG